MKQFALAIAMVLVTGIAHADTFKPGGLLVSTDCDAEICHSYTVEVSKVFVRLPIKRQLAIVNQFCAKLEKGAEDYQEEDGTPWVIQSCIFQYHGEDIAYRTNGRAWAEPAYIMALAALRD